jgi:hypothetical protein
MLAKIKSILKGKRYLVFTRPYELNIIGLRAEKTSSSLFSDELHVFFKKDDENWTYLIFSVSTDTSGIYDSLILKGGQHQNAFGLDDERNVLKQINPLPFLINGRTESKMQGIGFYKADKGKIANELEGWQVFQNEMEYGLFLLLCTKHRKLYGNRFTYTLIDFREGKSLIQKLKRIASLVTSLVEEIVK